jgi:hypothetical protein
MAVHRHCHSYSVLTSFLIYKKKGIMPHELNSDESVDGFGDDGFGDLQVERNGAEPTPSSTAEHGFPLLPESQENRMLDILMLPMTVRLLLSGVSSRGQVSLRLKQQCAWKAVLLMTMLGLRKQLLHYQHWLRRLRMLRASTEVVSVGKCVQYQTPPPDLMGVSKKPHSLRTIGCDFAMSRPLLHCFVSSRCYLSTLFHQPPLSYVCVQIVLTIIYFSNTLTFAHCRSSTPSLFLATSIQKA